MNNPVHEQPVTAETEGSFMRQTFYDVVGIDPTRTTVSEAIDLLEEADISDASMRERATTLHGTLTSLLERSPGHADESLGALFERCRPSHLSATTRTRTARDVPGALVSFATVSTDTGETIREQPDWSGLEPLKEDKPKRIIRSKEERVRTR